MKSVYLWALRVRSTEVSMPKSSIHRLLCSLGCIALFSGCHKDSSADTGSPIPAGLARIADCTAEAPGADELGARPETFNQLSGELDNLKWACGRGWIAADIGTVWEGLREPQVMVNNRDVAEYTVTVDEDPAFDYGWTLHNVVHDVITVEFDVQWDQGVVEGSLDAPEQVSARFSKTDGTPFIELMEGHIWLTATDDYTLVEEYQQMKAAQDPAEQIAQFEQDIFAELLAWSHGEPLPEFN